MIKLRRMHDITEINEFLLCKTPQAWIDEALKSQDIMLIDHAHCEKKAASTALTMMYRYVEQYELLQKLSRLAREELHHFEMVLKIMHSRGVKYKHLSPARYAEGLPCHIRNAEPDRLIDTLILGALIEARSCERFASLIPHLDPELSEFYASLLKSEARHFKDYLSFAQNISNEPIENRIELFKNIEMDLIQTPDTLFRFHSGVPVT